MLRLQRNLVKNPFKLYQKSLFSTEQQSSLKQESKLIAFASRSGLRFNDYNLLLDAVTHISYPQKTEDTGRLQLLGKKILELYVTQYVMKKYPSLPPAVCNTITDAYIGQNSLAAVGKVFGVQFVMRWKRSLENLDNPPIAPPIISSWVVESLVGALFQDQGAEAAKQFIHDRILSRSVDAEAHFDAWVKLNQPRQMLSYLMQKLNKPNPVARLLKETGRQSSSPVFLIGMYSGFEKVGQGYGSSLKMAETRAVKDALSKHYTKEMENITVDLDFKLDGEDSISFLTETAAHSSSTSKKKYQQQQMPAPQAYQQQMPAPQAYQQQMPPFQGSQQQVLPFQGSQQAPGFQQQHSNYQSNQQYYQQPPIYRPPPGPPPPIQQYQPFAAVEQAYIQPGAPHSSYQPPREGQSLMEYQPSPGYWNVDQGGFNQGGPIVLNGRRKCLLIGINYFGTRSELRGCINDVHNMKNFLISCGFSSAPHDMVILTDDQRDPLFIPTRINIINALRWLAAGNKAGDSLFLHFSGHGSRVQDTDGDESDGYDETICPVDYDNKRGGGGQIVDDELNDIIVKPLQHGVRLTAVFDCCHSGSALDLPIIYKPDGSVKQSTKLKKLTGVAKNSVQSYLRGDIGGAVMGILGGLKTIAAPQKTAQEKEQAKGNPYADVIMFSGCKDAQTSADAHLEGQATGAMSYSLIKALKMYPNISYGQLLLATRKILAEKFHQVPELSSCRYMDMNQRFQI